MNELNCNNLGFYVIRNSSFVCVCNSGWVGPTCSISLFQGYADRMAGYTGFTVFAAVYSLLLLATSIWFIIEHKKHNQTFKNAASPGIIGLSSLCFLLYMAINPYGQRITYTKLNFFLSSLFFNLSMSFTISAFTYIVIKWVTLSFELKNKQSAGYGVWYNRSKILFFSISGLSIVLAITFSAMDLLLTFSTQIYLGIVGLFSLFIGIILLLSSWGVYTHTKIRLRDKTDSKRRIAQQTIILSICILVSILILILMGIILFGYKDVYIMLFMFGFVIPSIVLMFSQTVSLLYLRFKGWKTKIRNTGVTMITQTTRVETDGENNNYFDDEDFDYVPSLASVQIEVTQEFSLIEENINLAKLVDKECSFQKNKN